MYECPPDRITALPAELQHYICANLEDVFTLSSCCFVSQSFAANAEVIIREQALPRVERVFEETRKLSRSSCSKSKGRGTQAWRVRLDIAWAVRATFIEKLRKVERPDASREHSDSNHDPNPAASTSEPAIGRRSRLAVTFSEVHDVYAAFDYMPECGSRRLAAIDIPTFLTLKTIVWGNAHHDFEPLDSQLRLLLGLEPP